MKCVCTSPGPNWFEYSQGALTIVLAFFVAGIAFLQYKNAKDKIRLDLYSKRFAVFAATREYLGHILRDIDLNHDQRITFLLETSEAEFLFKADISEYLKSLHDKGVDLIFLERKMRDAQSMDSAERAEASDEEQKLTHWFNAQLEVSKEKFSQYLKFEQTV